MELFENLPPAVTLVLALFVLVWLVLLFLLPFMVESIRGRTRRIHEELEDLNDKLDRLNRLLGDHSAPSYRAEPPRPERTTERPVEAAAPRVRREPTISDLPPIEPARRPPPSNPAVRR